MAEMKENDLRDRLFSFAVDTLKLLKGIGYGKESEVILNHVPKNLYLIPFNFFLTTEGGWGGSLQSKQVKR